MINVSLPTVLSKIFLRYRIDVVIHHFAFTICYGLEGIVQVLCIQAFGILPLNVNLGSCC